MCGIAGIFNFRSGAPVAEQQIANMIATIGHRGPDDDGYFLQGPLGLGHRRLTILDTSRRGRQPMEVDGGATTIVYNGEVYNFIELRSQLAAQGHTFRTTTDTEVVLRMYQQHGLEMLPAMNGMFAFALWDERRQRLVLARDRVGIKPLYYALTNDGIIFASEIKAILPVLGRKPAVNHDAIDTYMSVGYVSTEQTMFADIVKLQPGCVLTIENGKLEVCEWWDLQFDRPAENLSEQAYAEESLQLLKDSVRLQMRSDVPLGVFLSGGVDSAAVVALMHDQGIRDIQTFTVAYDYGHNYDETKYARQIAKHFQTLHHEIFVTAQEFQAFVPELVWHMDEPVTESAAISLFSLSKLAQEKVVVVLSGEGSDEVFGGYTIYSHMKALEHYRRLPRLLRRPINAVLNLGGDKWRKYTALSNLPIETRYPGVSFYEPRIKQSLYHPDFGHHQRDRHTPPLLRGYYRKTAKRDVLDRMMYLDIKSWLPDDLLIKADKITMACSLELRVPFLDHRIVELGARIPAALRVKGRTTKYILKKALEPYLPREILYRRKMGFPTPLAEMLRNEMRDYVDATLTSDRFRGRGYFRPDVVQTLLTEHAASKRDHHRVLWQLLVLEEWHRRFID